MSEEELIELKFRLADGSDIGPLKFSSTANAATLKEKVVALWPQEKGNGPKLISDIKLINAGRILENNTTLAESTFPASGLPRDVITMHVVLRPVLPQKLQDEYEKTARKKTGCSCSIL